MTSVARDEMGHEASPEVFAAPAVRRGSTRGRDPSAENRAGRHARLKLLVGFIVPISGFILWQIAGEQGWIDKRFFGVPSSIFTEFRLMVSDGTLPENIVITVRRLVFGFAIGTTVGVLTGLILGQSKWLRAAIEPTIRAFFVIPKIATLPIYLLIFGLGEATKVAYVSVGVFYLMSLSTLGATLSVPRAYYEVAESYQLSRYQMFKWVSLPHALPAIAENLRLVSALAVLMVTSVEVLTAREGLGYLIWHSWELFMPARMYVSIITVSVFGLLFAAVIRRLSSALTPWRQGTVGRTE